MLPVASVTPVKKPIGSTFLSHELSVMSLCFSSEIAPVCTRMTDATQPKSTPREASAIG